MSDSWPAGRSAIHPAQDRDRPILRAIPALMQQEDQIVLALFLENAGSTSCEDISIDVEVEGDLELAFLADTPDLWPGRRKLVELVFDIIHYGEVSLAALIEWTASGRRSSLFLPPISLETEVPMPRWGEPR